MRYALLHSLLLVLALCSVEVSAQSIQAHEYAGQAYGLALYDQESLPNMGQNWSITQDDRGLIYVANSNGVLEYDADTWRIIHVPDSATVFSVGKSLNGTVHAGARDEFGFLAPDSTGTLEYRSLLPFLSESDTLRFGEIWNTDATTAGVFYQSNSHLFRWDGSEITTWRSAERMHTSFVVNDTFYVKRDGIGIMAIDGDAMTLLPGTERFANHRVVFMGADATNAVRIYVQKGLEGPLEAYRYNSEGLTALTLDSHLDNDVDVYTFYHGSILPAGYFALSTLYHGVFVLDQDGSLVETLDADRGVGEDVNATFVDAHGGLWLAHNVTGLSYMASPAGLSSYGIMEGLKGAVNDVRRHKGRLYVATNDGLFTLEDRIGKAESEKDFPHFKRIKISDISNGIFWGLSSEEDALYVASEYGVIRVTEDRDGEHFAENIAFEVSHKPGVLLKSQFHDARMYVGLDMGWGVMSMKGPTYTAKKYDEIGRKISSMYESADGSLWIGTTEPAELWHVTFDSAGEVSKTMQVASGRAMGVSSMYVEDIGGTLGVIALPKGIFRAAKNELPEGFELVLDEAFQAFFAAGVTANNPVVDFVSDADSGYWVLYRDRLEHIQSYQDSAAIEVFSEDAMLPDWGKVKHLYAEPNGPVWFSSTRVRPLFKFEPDVRPNPLLNNTVDPLVRHISILSEDALYGGAFSSTVANAKFQEGKHLALDLSHRDNDFRFDFTLPMYSKRDQVEFRHKLEGHSSGWSAWTKERFADYRNISPGRVTFELESRVSGMPMGQKAAIPITVKAPWFWSWWTKSLYVLFLGFSLLQFVRFQRAKKELILLNIERELNARLQLANTQLRTANSSLEQANQMKDEFLANASHELRTPLTAILGFTSVLKEEVPQENLEFLGLIDENGKRLLKTINSLLDLAKLRAGMFELSFERFEIGEKTEEVVDLLNQLAKNRNLTLTVNTPPERIMVRLDEDCYERILYNLVGNAIKFTHEGGVRIEIEKDVDQVHVHVVDTGVGIDPDFIPQLFEEFKQEPNNDVRVEGSGLGLTITAKLVELLHGRIKVDSKKGIGSTFTVSFQIDEVTLPAAPDDKTSDRRAQDPHPAIQ
ncbi:MAG: ATP-binding protein [Bacteroidota bacterium]